MKKNTFIQHVVLLFVCVLSSANISAQGGTYASMSALATAVNNAVAAGNGGTFILDAPNNTFNNSQTTFKDKKATAANPIIIKAKTVGSVTFTGDSYINLTRCSYFTIEGFVFDATSTSYNSLMKLSGCNYIRMTRNVFELDNTTNKTNWVYIGGVDKEDPTNPDEDVPDRDNYSHHNRIDHNTFKNKTFLGNFITIDGTGDGTDLYQQSQYDRIDHNYFYKIGPRTDNEKESIRVGESGISKTSGYTTIDYNLFEECEGDPEVVSIKSCDNYIKHNTFRGDYGTLSFRHGDRNRAEGNYFLGNGRDVGSVTFLDKDNVSTTTTLYTGGMRMYGEGHVVINNYFEGLNGTKWDAPITITQGDKDISLSEASTSILTAHFRLKNLTVAYNTLVDNDNGIEIGFDNNNTYTKKVENVLIANNLITSNRNSMVKNVENDQGTAITWVNNLFYPSLPTKAGFTDATVSGGAFSFTDAQAKNENPNLVYNATEKLWRTTATTPLYANGSGVANSTDIDGQTRPASSNPGADHYTTMESVRYMPLAIADVGPASDLNDATLSTTEFAEIKKESNLITIYPVPAKQILNVDLGNLDFTTALIYNTDGRLVKSVNENASSTGAIDVSSLANGIYFLKILNKNVVVGSKQFIVSH